MQRRDFLKNTLSSIATIGASTSIIGSLASAAQPEYNWQLGWQSVDQDSFSPLHMKVQGKIPNELNGTFFRNGPAKFERDGQRYHHWFDGDGMVQNFSIANGSVSHSGKFIHTAKYLEEESAERFLYSGAGTAFANSQGARNNDTINTANTALQIWDDELLALWEGGSATAINLSNLHTKGIKTWHEDLTHMPFSAHPLTDEKGNMWNFGFAPYAGKTGKLVIYKIAPKKGLLKTELVDLPFKGYMHDFAQTKEHLIFLVPPYTQTKVDGRTFVESFEWKTQLESRLLVVNKDDLSQQKWFDLPPGFVFHFGHASEDKGTIQVNMCWYKDANIMQQGMVELMQLGVRQQPSPAVAATVVANLNTGRAKLIESTTNLEFPMFDESIYSADNTIYGVGNSRPKSGHADTLTAWSPYRGEIDNYRYPAGVMVEEPILVTSNDHNGRDNTDTAYIVQTFLNVGSRQGSGLNVFEANNLSAGPIAQATMDRALPLGFHGTFMAS